MDSAAEYFLLHKFFDYFGVTIRAEQLRISCFD